MTLSPAIRLALVALMAAGALLLTGCGDSGASTDTGSDAVSDTGGEDTTSGDGSEAGRAQGEDLAADACEHMVDGPAHAVAAAEDAADAPDATVEHMRVDVSLVDGPDGFTGFLTFTADEQGDLAFFLNQSPGFEVLGATGIAIEAEQSLASIDDCEEVFEGHIFELGAGDTVTLSFGPTSLSTISFVPVHSEE